eukprot:1096158-Pelagomonas_calceolata.AAC.1
MSLQRKWSEKTQESVRYIILLPWRKSTIRGAKKDVSIVYGCYKNINLGVKNGPRWSYRPFLGYLRPGE